MKTRQSTKNIPLRIRISYHALLLAGLWYPLLVTGYLLPKMFPGHTELDWFILSAALIVASFVAEIAELISGSVARRLSWTQRFIGDGSERAITRSHLIAVSTIGMGIIVNLAYPLAAPSYWPQIAWHLGILIPLTIGINLTVTGKGDKQKLNGHLLAGMATNVVVALMFLFAQL